MMRLSELTDLELSEWLGRLSDDEAWRLLSGIADEMRIRVRTRDDYVNTDEMLLCTPE